MKELIIQASFLERQMQETQHHLALIDNELKELDSFSKNLDFLQNSKEKDVISSLGKGIYIPAELKEKSLLVDVGSGILVKKTPEEAQEIVKNQAIKLTEARIHLISRLEVFQEELQKILIEFEKQQKTAKSK